MARPPLLVRPLATLAAGLLVAGVVHVAPASADEPDASLAVTVTAVGLTGGQDAAAPAQLGPAPGTTVLDIRVTNTGAEAVRDLAVTSSVLANGAVSDPTCDLGDLEVVEGVGPVLAAGAGVSCSATVSDVAYASVHEDVTTAVGTGSDSGSPVSAGQHFFAAAGDPSVRLGDRVWRDTDRDGVQDAGEPGLPGVTLALTGANPAVGPQTSAVDGSYAFTGLAPLPAGSRYTVAVDLGSAALAGLEPTTPTSRQSTDGLAPAGSDLGLDFGFAPVPVTPPAPVAKAAVRLTVDARPGTAVTGSTISVKGSLERAGKPFRASTVLERQVDGSSVWSKVATVRSSSTGALSASLKADRSASYRFRFAGDSTTQAGSSAADHVVVRKATVRLTVSAPGSVTKGRSIKVKGSIEREGRKYRATTVLEFRAGDDGSWSRVKKVRSSRKGSLSTSVKPRRSGEYRYRFAGNGTTAAGASRGDRVTVKPKPPAKPRPKAYRNCTALTKVYPHGVGRSGARDKGGDVTEFTRDTKTYNKNKKSDRDKDGIACERH